MRFREAGVGGHREVTQQVVARCTAVYVSYAPLGYRALSRRAVSATVHATDVFKSDSTGHVNGKLRLQPPPPDFLPQRGQIIRLVGVHYTDVQIADRTHNHVTSIEGAFSSGARAEAPRVSARSSDKSRSGTGLP